MTERLYVSDSLTTRATSNTRTRTTNGEDVMMNDVVMW
jgi:hypothetical protein